MIITIIGAKKPFIVIMKLFIIRFEGFIVFKKAYIRKFEFIITLSYAKQSSILLLLKTCKLFKIRKLID
jgi:hypothetical protein